VFEKALSLGCRLTGVWLEVINEMKMAVFQPRICTVFCFSNLIKSRYFSILSGFTTAQYLTLEP
jgi:hypothetical protein